MPVTDILIEPHGVIRGFFDCRDADPEIADQQRIEQAIARSTALASGNGGGSVLRRIHTVSSAAIRTGALNSANSFLYQIMFEAFI